MKEVRLSRGMAARSHQDALRCGLVIANSPRPDTNTTPRGLFYARNTTDGYINFAEDYANLNVTNEKPTPITVHFTLTPSNFPLLQERLYAVEPNFGVEVAPCIFSPITVFEDLREPTHSVLVDLSELGHKNLVDLDLYVGVKQSKGFRYTTYKQWSQQVETPFTEDHAIAA